MGPPPSREGVWGAAPPLPDCTPQMTHGCPWSGVNSIPRQGYVLLASLGGDQGHLSGLGPLGAVFSGHPFQTL